MIKTVQSDGRSIDQYIPRDLRRMFYQNTVPEYKYRRVDGYDPYGFPTDRLELYLPLWALKGSPIKSVDAYASTFIVGGALWRPDSRWFDGLDDDISASVPTVLDTLTAMTLIMWYKPNVDLDGQDTHRQLATFYGDGLDYVSLQYSHTENKFRMYEAISAGVDIDLIPAGATNVGESQDWHLIVLSLGLQGASIEIDLASYATNAATDCIKAYADSTPTTIFRFGDFTSGRPWSGNFGEIFIYNYQMSSAEKTLVRDTTQWRYQ